MAWDMTDFRKILEKYEMMYQQETDSLIKHELAISIASLKSEIVSEELLEFDKKLKEQEEKSETRLSPLNRFLRRFKAQKPIELNMECSYGSIVLDIGTTSIFKEVYPYLEDFFNKVKYLVDYSVKYGGPESKHIFSREEMIDLVHDLFRSTNKKVYDIYCILDNNSDYSIRFNINLSSNQGSHYCFPFVKDRFLDIGTDGDMELSLSTLAHEAGHFIGSIANEERYLTDRNYCEVESLFFELIAYDYFGDTLYKEYYVDTMKKFFESYIRDANSILITRNIADEFFSTFNRVKDPYGYYASLINSNSRSSRVELSKDINYTFSFIAALELFEIYKEDKDLAIDLLFKIMSEDKSKSEVARITDNIELNSHVDKHIKRLYLSRGGNHGMVQ